MRADLDEMIHQAIKWETVNFRERWRYGYVNPRKVLYIVHETGVSAYYKDFHIGDFATQSEAVRKVRDMAEHLI
jgi:hypothetical protein